MLGFIGFILAIVVIKFIIDSSKQTKQIARQGGMLAKYGGLVHALKSYDDRTRILQQTPSSLTLGCSSPGGRTLFEVVATFSTVTVKWTTDGPVFGKHTKSWDFPQDMDQTLMVEDIEADIAHITRRVLAQFERQFEGV